MRLKTFFASLASLASLAQAAETPLVTLSQAYEMTSISSEQIRMAKESLIQAELLTPRAFARVAPQISLGGTFFHQKELVQSFGSVVVPANQQVYSASLNWPLLQFEFIPRYSQGGAVVESKQAYVEFVTQRTLYGVALSYYTVLKSRRLTGLAQEFQRQAQEHFRVAKAKFEQGEVRKTVMIQAELDVERAKKRLIEQDNNVKVAKEELRSALSLTLQDFDVQDPPALTWPADISPQTTLNELVDFALTHRPDARQAELDIKSAWADKEAAFTRVLPTAGIQAGYSVTDPQTVFSQREQWRVGAVVNIPLFQGGEEWLAQSDQASRARQTEMVREAMTKQIEIDVKKAYYAWQVLEKNLEVLKKQVELSRENYRMVENQFKEGLASSSEVTDAHVGLINAEVELVQERYNYQLAILTLLKTLGIFRP